MNSYKKMLELLEEEDYDNLKEMILKQQDDYNNRPDKSYLRASVFSVFYKRIPWLLLLMVSAIFTSRIISAFEASLVLETALVAYIPMLMGAGGNAGIQASSEVIRGLSLQELKAGDYLRVLWKEIQISFLSGIVLAIGVLLKIWLIDNLLFRSEVSLLLSIVVCITMFATILFSKIVGCTLPMLADRLDLDPAAVSGPFITTLVDTMSLVIYFGFATFLLSL